MLDETSDRLLARGAYELDEGKGWTAEVIWDNSWGKNTKPLKINKINLRDDMMIIGLDYEIDGYRKLEDK